ncbi:TraB/GumN family protein [Polaromonas sp.]|uniref:TraB/GumN family protein n=1 Tax=Polaromonas sp. TaxID=1869339 RepID=UPI00352AF5CB
MYYSILGTGGHILGGMHLVPNDEKKWLPQVECACVAASDIWLESDAGLTFFTAKWRSGAEVLPGDLSAALGAKWGALGIGPLEDFNLPAISVLTSLLFLSGLREGVEPAVKTIVGAAQTLNALESVDEYLAGWACVSDEQFIDQIRLSLRRGPQTSADFRSLHNGWRRWDRAALAKLNDATLIAPLRPAVFANRNRAWAVKIACACAEQTRPLFVVGAGHLCGPGNLLDVLRQEHQLDAVRA